MIDVWHCVRHGTETEPGGLIGASGSYFNEDLPGAALIIEIIIQATKDGDLVWLLSGVCRYYCAISGLNHRHIVKLMHWTHKMLERGMV